MTTIAHPHPGAPRAAPRRPAAADLGGPLVLPANHRHARQFQTGAAARQADAIAEFAADIAELRS